MRRLFRQFSTPGGIPSHVSVPTPGSIHEGGELGYVLVHAFGAAFDNPDLHRRRGRRRRRGGDRAARRLLEGHQLPQPGPRRRGAADPAPERLQDRRPDRAGPRPATTMSATLLEGHGYEVHFVEGDDPPRDAPGVRRDAGRVLREDPRHPGTTRARSGFTGATALAGHRAAHAEGLDRAEGRRWPAGRGHVPRPPGAAGQRARRTPTHLAMLEAWMRSYRPEELFDATGRLVPELAALAPEGRPAHGRQPARQRRQARSSTSTCPTSATTRSPSRDPADRAARVDAPARQDDARHLREQRRRGELPALLPRRDELEPAGRRLRGREPLLRRHDHRDRRPRRAGRPGDGGAQRAPLPGLAGGLRC